MLSLPSSLGSDLVSAVRWPSNAKNNSTDCLNMGLTGSGCPKEVLATVTPKK